ncbi:hypothetical protein K457DRAFT_142480 [Linnemannia elongata AG-77]|uniref:Uncharacterized protein n=1 Tax=Linnemannia elongata AG-77 TaxID=1314771 RepID=A0A197JF33_9FUNG|nr:hypothetical protein K457DRAFT_142480 [Linnemannia elongata AG-77]
MANVQQYRQQITDLIRQADITTVSARSIRKKVEALARTDLGPVKEQFDELVMEIYEQITDENERLVLSGGSAGLQHNGVQQQNGQIQPNYMPAAVMQPAQNAFGGFALPPTSYVAPKPVPPPVKKAAPAKRPVTPESSRESDDDSDASFSSVEGSSKKRQPKKESSKKSSSSSSAAKKKKEADKKKKDADKKKKDASKKRSSSSKDKDKDDDEPKKKRAKPLNEDGTEKVNGFTRPYAISDTLYQVIGTYGETGPSGRIEMPRHQVVKFLWVYIKENNLQDEKDKRNIVCDDKLKALFGLDQINCFSMNKYIGAHLIKPEDVVQPYAAQ